MIVAFTLFVHTK